MPALVGASLGQLLLIAGAQPDERQLGPILKWIDEHRLKALRDEAAHAVRFTVGRLGEVESALFKSERLGHRGLLSAVALLGRDERNV